MAWSCYCYANCHENVTILLKILEIHSMEKTEKPLQILRFLRFSEYRVEPTFVFPKPRRRVRFPYPAPKEKTTVKVVFSFGNRQEGIEPIYMQVSSGHLLPPVLTLVATSIFFPLCEERKCKSIPVPHHKNKTTIWWSYFYACFIFSFSFWVFPRMHR